MIDPRKFPREVLEMWAAHQVFMAMGFDAENIYVYSDNLNQLGVVLRTNGKEFVYTIGRYKNKNQLQLTLTLWTEFTDAHNDKVFDRAILDRIYENSYVVKNKVQLIMAMAHKGILPPADFSYLN